VPKVKLSAGNELDILNKDELSHALEAFRLDWQVEATIGPKVVRFGSNAVVTAAGGLSLGGNGASLVSGRLGPAQSMVWSVKRVAVTGLKTPGDSLALYVNTDQPGNLVHPSVTGYLPFGSDQLVLMPDDTLLFTGAALLAPAGSQIYVSGQAWELPVTMMYRLL